eukprot:TRINITY_DN35620_c0_g1_i1.p1 TRINITY_DN35620_c0_g1~~TRINITY_DN35620_c0_g1_i1.p1  ORF type:complete len:1433 (-),score=235.72 TRINITY_DN35620_c0_g1_i1:330-4628(-)
MSNSPVEAISSRRASNLKTWTPDAKRQSTIMTDGQGSSPEPLRRMGSLNSIGWRKNVLQRGCSRQGSRSLHVPAGDEDKPKWSQRTFGNAQEVILSDTDSDIEVNPDQEDEELDKALHEVTASGRLAIDQMKHLGPRLRIHSIFDNVSNESLVAAMRHATMHVVGEGEFLWSKRSTHSSQTKTSRINSKESGEAMPDITGVLEESQPFIVLLSGVLYVLQDQDQVVEVSPGLSVSTADGDILSIIAMEDCQIIVASCHTIQEELKIVDAARADVLAELRRLRPPSTWPESLINRFAVFLRDMPFFEDHEIGIVRRITRNLRYSVCDNGESLPFLSKVRGGNKPNQKALDRDEDTLVIFLGGSAGTYEQVDDIDRQRVAQTFDEAQDSGEEDSQGDQLRDVMKSPSESGPVNIRQSASAQPFGRKFQKKPSKHFERMASRRLDRQGTRDGNSKSFEQQGSKILTGGKAFSRETTPVSSAGSAMVRKGMTEPPMKGLNANNADLLDFNLDLDEVMADQVGQHDAQVQKVRYLKRKGELGIYQVLGERYLLDPDSTTSGPIIRCEGHCEVLVLYVSDYLRCLTDQMLEKQRMVYALKHVPPSHPGEPHQRSEEQLILLSKMIAKCPEFADLPRSTLMQVVGAATYLQCSSEHVLCRQGEVGNKLFAIIEGRVGIHVQVQGQQQVASKPKRPMGLKKILQSSDKGAVRAGILDVMRKHFDSPLEKREVDNLPKGPPGSPSPPSSSRRRVSIRSPTDENIHTLGNPAALARSTSPSDSPTEASPEAKRTPLATMAKKGSASSKFKKAASMISKASSVSKRFTRQSSAAGNELLSPTNSSTGGISRQLSPASMSESSCQLSVLDTESVSRSPSEGRSNSGRQQESLSRTSVLKAMLKKQESGTKSVDGSKRSVAARRSTLRRQASSDSQDKDRAVIARGRFQTIVRKACISFQASGKGLLGDLVNRLSAGACFGAKTLLKREARTASCKTIEACKLLVVTRDDYVALMNSKGEAAASEAMEFLCKYLLRLGPSNHKGPAKDRLPLSLQQRLERCSKEMKAITAERGTVLVCHGAETCEYVWWLRKGTLAICNPPAMPESKNPIGKGCRPKPLRNTYAAMSVSRVVSCPGELIGATHAILGYAEPATVRVESACADLYKVPLAEMKRLMPSRFVQHRNGIMNTREEQRATDETPKDLLTAMSNASRKMTKPVGVDLALMEAKHAAFEAATDFAGAFRDGEVQPGIQANLKPPNSARSARSRPPLSARSRATEGSLEGTATLGAGTRDAATKSSRKEASYMDRLQNALTVLEQAQTNMGVVVDSGPTRNVKSRAPPDTSASHFRAQILQAMGESSEACNAIQRLAKEAQLDPKKENIELWLKKYMFSPLISHNPELQDLNLLVRNHLHEKKRPVSAQRVREQSANNNLPGISRFEKRSYV